MDSIDVVYVLGKGTKWNDNEIRFSLRSLAKNVTGIRNVYIVGERPDFLKRVIHISYPDELLNNADGNIIRKLLRVCQEERLSSDFLFVNDDHVFMKPMVAAEIPAYHKGDMTKIDRKYFEENFWRGRLYRTMNILIQKGFTAYHFDCHVPIVINKIAFPAAMEPFDYARNIGYTMKSLYANIVCTDAPLLNGEKVTLFRPYTFGDIMKRIEGRLFVAFNDSGLTPILKELLFHMFPEPCKYEKTVDVPAFEIISWLWNEERDYEKGVELYNKYGKGNWAKMYFAKVQSRVRDEKLIFKLRQLLNYL